MQVIRAAEAAAAQLGVKAKAKSLLSRANQYSQSQALTNMHGSAHLLCQPARAASECLAACRWCKQQKQQQHSWG